MDHHDKLNWSMQHLNALDAEIEAFVKDHPFTARGETYPDAKQVRIFANEYPPLPPHWPLMVGDAIQNMRSALDHIIWALTLQSPTQPNPSEALKIQFPICTTKGQYWGDAKQKGRGGQRYRGARFIPAEALAIVDGAQPFNRGDAAYDDALAKLARYSNEDKHRKLVLIGAAGTPVRFTIQKSGGMFRLEPYTVTYGTMLLERDAELAIIQFSEATTVGGESEMEVEPHVAGDIAFREEGGALYFVIPSLKKLNHAIREELFPPLDALLQ